MFCLQGCVNLVYLCGKNKKQHVAALIFFHMLLVVWCFGVRCLRFLQGMAGCRSHLFSHITDCVVFWCEMFALTNVICDFGAKLSQ